MAQHIDINHFIEERFKEIEKIITNDFNKSKGLLKTSFRYRYINSEDNQDIYIIEKRIPKGIVLGDRASFEIHWNKDNEQIDKIYLVA